jgi:hypothetical protein
MLLCPRRTQDPAVSRGRRFLRLPPVMVSSSFFSFVSTTPASSSKANKRRLEIAAPRLGCWGRQQRTPPVAPHVSPPPPDERRVASGMDAEAIHRPSAREPYPRAIKGRAAAASFGISQIHRRHQPAPLPSSPLCPTRKGAPRHGAAPVPGCSGQCVVVPLLFRVLAVPRDAGIHASADARDQATAVRRSTVLSHQIPPPAPRL